MKYLRQFIRQIIKESTEPSHLAAIVYDNSYRKCAVIYDTKTINQISNTEKDLNNLRMSLCSNVIKGFIEVGPWHGGKSKCNNAWMVYRVAGPNLGKILYSIGYALSPSGRLMSDREDISPSANNAWMSAFNKTQYKKIPLDDEDAHNHLGLSLYDHPNHTDDTSDDCTLFKGPSGDENPENYPHLQYSYEGTGEELSLLNTMQNNNTTTLKLLFPGHENEIENLIKSAGPLYFQINTND